LQSIFYKNGKKNKFYSAEKINHQIHIDISLHIVYMQSKLNHLKIPELKQIAKAYHLKISGKKQDIIDRIKLHILRESKAIQIQKYFRRFFIQSTLRIRGKCVLQRNLCNNQSDPITLEPINEIHPLLFIAINDGHKYYGFNITSLFNLLKQNNKTIINPYNRNKVDFHTIKNILKAYNHTIILNPLLLHNYEDADNNSHNTNEEISRFYLSLGVSRFYYHPVLHNSNQSNNPDYQKICSFRKLSMEQRIQNLFTEFDRLGNYTQSSWFSNLTTRNYPRFYRCLKDIWQQRANLSHSMKSKICHLYDPFLERIFSNRFVVSRELPLDNERILNKVKLSCICSMETLTFTGIDEEHCKLGALYCLMALTSVSQSARIALPWLYDSIS